MTTEVLKPAHVGAPLIPVDALTADGRIVRIRPATVDDAEALVALHDRVSDQSRYFRFFNGSTAAAREYAVHLATASPSNSIVLVVEHAGRLVAVGCAEILDQHEAEVAFLVDDTVHGAGIGTLLLEHLAAAARARGIRIFHADVLATNRPMLTVFQDAGFGAKVRGIGPTKEILLDTVPDPLMARQITDRERQAEDHSLAHVLAPRSVAVIGAGHARGGIGHELLRNLLDGGFTGAVYAVNRKGGQIAGLNALHSIADVPGPVDLAVIAVPAPAVPAVVRDCCAAGVAGIVITTAGFGEAGEDGGAAQRELVNLARRHGVRIIGPNCLGVLNTNPYVRLNATFGPATPRPGVLSVASQSGAVGVAMLDHADRAGVGIAEFVSLGNKADVSGNDLLLHWWGDPRTRVIGLYLESFGNPLKFARLARQVSRDKPILLVKGGRSGAGARAGASHTAAATTPETVMAALCAQSGVVRVDSMPDLLDAARVFADQPLPAGRRLAILGNAGGAQVLAADAATTAGLDVPMLSEATRRALAAVGPGAVGSNPVDLGAGTDADAMTRAVAVLIASGEVDTVLAVVAATRANDAAAMLDAVARTAAAHPQFPVVATCLGVPNSAAVVESGSVRVPVFAFPEQAVRALGHVADHADWRRRPPGVVPTLHGVDLSRARRVVNEFLATHQNGGWLPTDALTEVAHALGIPFTKTIEVTGTAEAITQAHRLGVPVVLKTGRPDIVHKSDVGGVRLGLRDDLTIANAYWAITEAANDGRVLVQTMVPSGVEMLVGLVRDPVFGPVIMVGTGGVLTDLVADRAWRGLPLTDRDAAEMVAGLRGAKLLAGYRGAPPRDVEALRELIHRVALLAGGLPEVAEMDLNPVVVGSSGATAVDLRIRVTPAPPTLDPYLPRLS